MAIHDLSGIPSFTLYDRCFLTEAGRGSYTRNVILYRINTFRPSETGDVITHTGKNDDGSYDWNEVDEYEKYLSFVDGKFTKWNADRCLEEFLGGHNKSEYLRLISITKDYESDLNFIKESDYAITVFKYLANVKRIFRDWLDSNGIEKPTIDSQGIESGSIEKQPNKDEQSNASFQDATNKLPRKPKHRELQKLCMFFANKIKLNKYEPLKGYNAEEILDLITAENIISTLKSVKSTLNKLGYKKSKY